MNIDAVYAPDLSTRYALPIFLGRLPAGFPSPADDYLEGKLDGGFKFQVQRVHDDATL